MPTLVVLGALSLMVARYGRTVWFRLLCGALLIPISVLSILVMLRPEYWVIVTFGQAAVAIWAILRAAP
ncbi:hypothetical protein J2S43_001634 [Catenuloplanes nepalensis]|uniref:Uncharacterized protein n=1 Tax=Catenuloplanes nepalensis TaxID=587533 RepID=A0ABT9MNY4_9ACTN|nr:hypothetical protein [Catenuloplanes nepalensis]MDP9793122.1 hypothetical protein [Catenuloplanes nepalensis]